MMCSPQTSSEIIGKLRYQSRAPLRVHVSQADGRLLSQDVQALEKIWFTLDQLAGDRFKAILQGTGYLRGPKLGLSQKVVVSVVKKTDGRVKTSRVERSRVRISVPARFFRREIFVEATYDASALFH